jgi:hypothetical protein
MTNAQAYFMPPPEKNEKKCFITLPPGAAGQLIVCCSCGHGVALKSSETILQQLLQWNSTFLTSSFIIEGASKKVLQFLIPEEPIYNKNICFNEQKCLV